MLYLDLKSFPLHMELLVTIFFSAYRLICSFKRFQKKAPQLGAYLVWATAVICCYGQLGDLPSWVFFFTVLSLLPISICYYGCHYLCFCLFPFIYQVSLAKCFWVCWWRCPVLWPFRLQIKMWCSLILPLKPEILTLKELITLAISACLTFYYCLTTLHPGSHHTSLECMILCTG